MQKKKIVKASTNNWYLIYDFLGVKPSVTVFFFFLSVLVIHCYMGFYLVAASCSYSSCGAQTLIAMASLVVEHGLWSTGSTVVLHGPMAPWQVRSSQMRDRTHVSCSGRQILYH